MCMGSDGQKAGQHEMQLAQMAREEVNYWKKGGFRDLENAAILDAKKAGAEPKMQQARGKAHVAAMRGMQLPAAVNPNSGTATTVAAGIGAAAGDVLAKASNEANIAKKAESKSGLVDMSKFGRGQQGIGMRGLAQVAQMENENTRTDRAIDQSAKSFNAELVGTAAGAATGMAMGGSAPKTDVAQWDAAKNTVTGADSMTLDVGNVPNDWEMGMAKIKTMFS